MVGAAELSSVITRVARKVIASRAGGVRLRTFSALAGARPLCHLSPERKLEREGVAFRGPDPDAACQQSDSTRPRSSRCVRLVGVLRRRVSPYLAPSMCDIMSVHATATGTASDPCRVLEEDSDLAEAVPVEHRDQAIRECLAAAFAVPVGSWRAPRTTRAARGIGLLVLHGLLIRRVGVDGRYGAELLGAGDILRPWQGEDEPPLLPITTGWRVVEPAKMAALDERFQIRMGRFPQLSGSLVARALQRSRNLAISMAIVHQPRVDVRLQMMFWHLATRWGRVRGDGVSVPLRLTHSVLADLTAARRPTVSSALSELTRRGLVQAVPDGWLLRGIPPGELVELGAVPPDFGSRASSGRSAL